MNKTIEMILQEKQLMPIHVIPNPDAIGEIATDLKNGVITLSSEEKRTASIVSN